MNKKQKIFEIVFIFLLSLTPLLWLRDNMVILGHDSGFRIKSLQYLGDLFYSWNPNSGFGIDLSINKGFLITQFPETFFTTITNSLHYGELLTLIFWFFVIGISMYLFVNGFFPEKKNWFFRIFSSLLYQYNFFILQGWFIAERAKFSLYAALPLGLLVIIKTFTQKYSLLKGTILFSFIFFFLNGGGSPPLYGAVLLVYGLTFIFLIITSQRKQFIDSILRSLKIVVCFGIGTLLINGFWIIPQIYLAVSSYSSSLSSQGGIEGILGWEAVVSKYASLMNILRLQGIPDWYENPSHPYSNAYLENPFLIMTSLLPIVVILVGFSLFYKRKVDIQEKKIIFLTLFLLLVGILFTAGSHPPFGIFYTLLIKYIPGFAIFRSAFYKFGPAVWFSFAFLTGYFLQAGLSRIKNKIVVKGAAGVLILSILLYHFPYFIGNFFNWNNPFSTKVTVPSYVVNTAHYINSNTSESLRILLFPHLSEFPFADSYEWNFWSLDILPILAINRSVVTNTGNAPQVVTELYDVIQRGDTDLFNYGKGLLGINGILLRKDIMYGDKIIAPENVYTPYEKILKSSDTQKKYTDGKWEYYSSLGDYVPLLYSSKIIGLYSGSTSILDMLNSVDKPKTPVLIDLSTVQEPLKNELSKMASFEFTEAECIYCKGDEWWQFQEQTALKEVRFLPDSFLYAIVDIQEKKLRNSVKNNPPQLIDAELSFATNRLFELREVSLRSAVKENAGTVATEIIENYKKSMQNVLSQLSHLSGGQKDEYAKKILMFIKLHERLSETIVNKPSTSLNEFNNHFAFLKKIDEEISPQVWATTVLNQKKLQFSVASDGTYQIFLQHLNDTPTNIFVDRKLISDLKNVSLQPGVHTLELDFNDQENNLQVNSSESAKISLHDGNKIGFVSNGVSDRNEYLIHFDYKIIDGKNPTLFINQKKNGKTQSFNIGVKSKLEIDDQFNPFYYVFKPSSGTTDVELEFKMIGLDEQSTFEIKNLEMKQLDLPKVIISRTVADKTIQTPEILFHKINPTRYHVSVKNAREPFILNFNESFNPGWKLYPLTSWNKSYEMPFTNMFIQSEKEETHFKSNGYSNGWFIDKKGNAEFIIEYIPQRYTYLGVFVSVISIIIFALLLFIKNEKFKK